MKVLILRTNSSTCFCLLVCAKNVNVIFVNEYHVMEVNSKRRCKSLYALNLGTKWRCV